MKQSLAKLFMPMTLYDNGTNSPWDEQFVERPVHGTNTSNSPWDEQSAGRTVCGTNSPGTNLPGTNSPQTHYTTVCTLTVPVPSLDKGEGRNVVIKTSSVYWSLLLHS